MAILGDHARDESGLLYEVDDSGARVLVRSLESTHQVYIRFTNMTSRPVLVWWRDFLGAKRLYACLKPTEYLNIDTFTTHPWEFTDEATGERYNIGRYPIFRAPRLRGDPQVRCNWNINVCLRTLRDTALLYVALAVPKLEQVSALGLPRELADDLTKLIQILTPNQPTATQTQRNPLNQ